MQPDAMNTLPQIQPVSKVEPISPTEMRSAFGGPLYQMLNPGTRQIVDNLGLRGQGIGGLAAKKFRRQRANYERELANVPYDGPPAQRAADKYLNSLKKTQAELEMVYERNRGFGLYDYIRSGIATN